MTDLRVALYSHAISQQHGRTQHDGAPLPHPEQPDRIKSILAALEGQDFASLIRKEAPMVSVELIKKYHDPSYVDAVVAEVALGDVVAMDADTHKTFASAQAALRSVGAACDAVNAVISGSIDRAFVAMRPPGHHAERHKAMGFCFFGTVAIAAQEALTLPGVERVAVVDFDVHHGNGTQNLLWDQPNVLLVTSQQMPLWPGTGKRDERGEHGQMMNIPLPPGSDGSVMREAYVKEAFPALERFNPDLLLLSAGFDAHADDPLAGLNWQLDDFVWLTEQLVMLADKVCAGRIVSCLEGGYDLNALEEAVAAHVRCLMRHASNSQILTDKGTA